MTDLDIDLWDPTSNAFHRAALNAAMVHRCLDARGLAAASGVSLRTIESARAGRRLHPRTIAKIRQGLAGTTYLPVAV